MKRLLTIVTILASINSFADCSITLGVKSETAKNAKLNGVSFSAKQLEALESICKVNKELMSDDQLVADFKASLQHKHERASKSK